VESNNSFSRFDSYRQEINKTPVGPKDNQKIYLWLIISVFAIGIIGALIVQFILP